MLEGPLDQTWRCISNKGGSVGKLTKVAGGNSSDAASAAASPETRTKSRTERVQFDTGTSGTTKEVCLNSGDAIDLVLGASAGLFLGVILDTAASDLLFTIYVPDGEILHESARAGITYTGQIFESGDHRIQVFCKGDTGTTGTASLSISMK